MANYSVTLNFFIPQEIVENLKKAEITGDCLFDYRYSDFCHCTVKAIAHFEVEPEQYILDEWVTNIKKLLDSQKSFSVRIRDMEIFPTAVFANIYSEELEILHRKLFNMLPSSQEKFENENYIPHATIWMIKDVAKIISDKNADFGEFNVNEMQLMIWNNDIKKIKAYHIFKLI